MREEREGGDGEGSASSWTPHRALHSEGRAVRACTAKDAREREREGVRGEGKGKAALEEVVWGSARDVRLSSSGSRIELQEGMFHVFVEFHDGCLVTAAVAVVGSGEDGDDALLVAPVVALHDELMRSGDERETVGTIELL